MYFLIFGILADALFLHGKQATMAGCLCLE